MQSIKEQREIFGKITIATYRAGMVEAIEPLLKARQVLWGTVDHSDLAFRVLDEEIEATKTAFFIRNAVECRNLIMANPSRGIDLIIQRLISMNTYSLNITHGEIGTGATAPTLGDTGLTTPTNRAAVGFQQDFGQSSAIVQFFFSDSQLANDTYSEFGTFVDGTPDLGSGQIFNHALLSPTYEKVPGQDTTTQVEFGLANA